MNEIQIDVGNKKLIYMRKSGNLENGSFFFIHGIGTSSQSWKGLEKQFENCYECYSMDLRGHGRSMSDEPESTTIEQLTQDCIHIIDEIDIKKPVVLVGHSLGCILALSLITRGYFSKSKVVLISPPYKSPLNLIGEGTNEFDIILNKADVLRAGLWYFLNFINKHVLRYRSRAADKAAWRIGRRSDPKAVYSTINSIKDLDLIERIPKIDNRMLMIFGERDRFISRRAREEVGCMVPECLMEIIEGAGHAPHFDKPKTVADIILEFIER